MQQNFILVVAAVYCLALSLVNCFVQVGLLSPMEGFINGMMIVLFPFMFPVVALVMGIVSYCYREIILRLTVILLRICIVLEALEDIEHIPTSTFEKICIAYIVWKESKKFFRIIRIKREDDDS